MHLIINTLSITPDGGGIKTYLTHVASALCFHKSKPKITLICSRSSYKVFQVLEGETNVQVKKIPVSSSSNLIRIFLDQVIVPFILLLNFKKGDILITPSSIATIFSPLKQITILQAPLVLKNIREEMPDEYLSDFSLLKKLYYDFFLKLTVKRSDTIITVSKYLQSKLLELYPSVQNKVEVVYEGVEFDSLDDSKNDLFFDGKETEILFVSTLYGYKNADQLIKAFAQLKQEKIEDKELRLKIIGNDPTGGSRLQSLKLLVKKSGVETSVDFLGYIPHEQILSHYKRASVFVFPSSVETFGLPPLEAMACGVPVIASNRMSVPEVIGDAGLVVDPDDIDAITLAIKKIIQNKDLRQKLVANGYSRVEHFKWSDTAEKILKIVLRTIDS